MSTTDSKDLFVLAADLELKNALDGLLSRTKDLGARDVAYDIERHPNRDSGCRSEAVEYLRPYLRGYRQALVVFDHYGCGSTDPREEIQLRVEEQLRRNGWGDRAKVIVIEPELEVWVWGGSPAACRVLGWDRSYAALRRWLVRRRFWEAGEPKPSEPKKAMREAMQHGRVQRSARKFSELARAVDFDRCKDAAFGELKHTLVRWFPRNTAG